MTQCVTNWEGLVKEPHVPQIGSIEAAPELSRQRLGQDRQEPSAILSTGCAALLKLNNVTADLPAGVDLDRIDSPKSLLASALNELTEAMEQSLSSP
jgi:hypothetical protein